MRKAKDSFDEYFPGGLEEGTLEPFLHSGEWAIHQALSWFLERTGPADVMMMTFNVSEDGLRSIFFEDRIKTLRLLLDLNIRRHKLDLLLFASSLTPDLRLERTHSKLLLIESEGHSFGITGSANLNNPHRYESGFYFTEGPTFDFFKQRFLDIFDKALPYDATELHP